MKVTVKRLFKNNFEVQVVVKGKFKVRLGNIIIDNNKSEIIRLDFNLLKKYISGGVVFSESVKKRMQNVLLLL
jgi:hypothetical protein